MRKIVPVALALLSALPAAAQDDALQRCRGVADAAARLACYDAIPLRSAPRTAPAVAPAPAPARVAAPADRFGLPEKPAADGQSIVSAVAAGFDGWGPSSRIRLENGQVWEVTDSSSGTVGAANRRVTVRRGALGSYWLEFEGMNKSPRVRRVE